MKSQTIILKHPMITEKITAMQDAHNQYAFVVDKNANKIEIKKEVENRFDVKVLKVNTMNIRGKIKTQGRFSGRKASWKKAVVTLKKGFTIEFFENI